MKNGQEVRYSFTNVTHIFANIKNIEIDLKIHLKISFYPIFISRVCVSMWQHALKFNDTLGSHAIHLNQAKVRSHIE